MEYSTSSGQPSRSVRTLAYAPAVLASLMLFSGCSRPSEETGAALQGGPAPIVFEVELQPASSTVQISKQTKFVAAAVGPDGSTVSGVSFAFSADRVGGQIGGDGTFTAGTTAGTYDDAVTIEATLAEVTKTATAKVIVEPGPLERVTLEPASSTVEAGQSHLFTAAALDQFDNRISGLTFVFTSAEEAGHVGPDGTFTAGEKAGSYRNALSVETPEGFTIERATASVTVEPGPLDRVILGPASLTLQVTQQQQIGATAFDRFGNPTPGLAVVFRSKPEAGRIDDQGLFTAGTRAGSYEDAITAEMSQGSITRSASATVVVQAEAITLDGLSLELEPALATLEVAQQLQFTAKGLDQFGNAIPGLTFAFTADTDSGQIDADGLFTATAMAGSYPDAVSAEVTLGPVTQTATASVVAEPAALHQIRMAPPTMEVAQRKQMVITAFDRFDNAIPGLAYVFRLSEEAGQIDADGTLVAGTTAGIYEGAISVEATQGAITRAVSAPVTLFHGPLDHVTLDPEQITLVVRESLGLSAVAEDVYGNPIPEAQITWRGQQGVGTVARSALDIGEVNGRITAGTRVGAFDEGVKVTAEHGGASAQAIAPVTVEPGPLAMITVSDISVAADTAQQLEGMAADQYGNPLPDAEVTWTLLEANAGALTASGLLTAGEVAMHFPGAIGVQAAHGGLMVEGAAPITVTPGPLDRMVIGPSPAEIRKEMTQQFVAVGADRSGNRIAGLDFEWSVESDGGGIGADGLFTAGGEPGIFEDTVRATATQGDVTRSATASVEVEPDRVAFISDRDGQLDVYVMSLDGSDIQRLTQGDAGIGRHTIPSWSPDGRRMAFNTCFDPCGTMAITAMNDDGSWRVNLPGEGRWPSWSNDGRRFALVPSVTGGLHFMDMDGGNLTLVVDPPADESTPSWFPDGRKIAYTQIDPSTGNSNVYVVDVDGFNHTALTSRGLDEAPKWSPDGSRLIFISSRDGDRDVYVMDDDGGNVRSLTFNSSLDDGANWSADGTQVVFFSVRFGGSIGELFAIGADGKSEGRLTADFTDDAWPAWAPPKRGVAVSEASVVITGASALVPQTPQDAADNARAAVVRIETDTASGSGFVIDPSGFILTSNHLIVDTEPATVYMEDGTSYSATVHGRDMVRDLALLKVRATGLPTLELGDLSQVPVGAPVLSLGLLAGGATTTEATLVSIEVDSGRNTLWVRTDSPVVPGTGGGPLLSLQGYVIGVLTSGAGEPGLGFAVSANTVKLYLDRMKAEEVIFN